MKDNIIEAKSFKFSLEIIELYKALNEEKEYILSKQLLRSGTSIGANIVEAEAAQSKADFISKMSIASKEARETEYWLMLLQESGLTKLDLTYLIEEVGAIIRIVTSIVKTSRENLVNSTSKIQNC